MNLNFSSKVFIIVLIFSATLLYAVYERSKFAGLIGKPAEMILKKVPEFEARTLDGQVVSEKTLLDKSKRGFFVHFWGTWCGPCEAEFPDFLKLAREFENKGVHFFLLAVNDKDAKIKKFIRRFDKFPSNVTLAHDSSGESLDLFGTVKVPETYLFGSRGQGLEKFIGPQEWLQGNFDLRVESLLSQQEMTKSIETH